MFAKNVIEIIMNSSSGYILNAYKKYNNVIFKLFRKWYNKRKYLRGYSLWKNIKTMK